MRKTLRTGIHLVAFAGALAAIPSVSYAARQCDARAFGVQIDQTAQALRTLNRDSEARFQDRLQAIAKARGWTDAQRSDAAMAAMDDRRLETFNAEIEELVGQLDALSSTPKGEISCVRLDELKTVQDRLVAVMGQKSGFILAQLEAEGAKAPIPAPAPPAATVAKSDPPLPAAAEKPQSEQGARPNSSWSVNIAQTPPATPPSAQRPAASAPATAAPRPAPAQNERVASLPPPAVDAPTPSSNPSTGYSMQEIREAGQDLFGSLTSEFAIVMSHAFKTYGQPNAYIIGDEGGGAFLAGLRFGDGKLYSRINGVESGPTRVYWQGPSLGADVGATGSRTLFLVYNLNDVQTLYRRFPGIDGSAYVAGGVGLTVYKSGDTLIVPIRTGLGLRLGASIAYLKFTEHASLNPF